MELEFEVWGDSRFGPILLGTYATQVDAETVIYWLTVGKVLTNLHLEQSGRLFGPESKS